MKKIHPVNHRHLEHFSASLWLYLLWVSVSSVCVKLVHLPSGSCYFLFFFFFFYHLLSLCLLHLLKADVFLFSNRPVHNELFLLPSMNKKSISALKAFEILLICVCVMLPPFVVKIALCTYSLYLCTCTCMYL